MLIIVILAQQRLNRRKHQCHSTAMCCQQSRGMEQKDHIFYKTNNTPYTYRNRCGKKIEFLDHIKSHVMRRQPP